MTTNATTHPHLTACADYKAFMAAIIRDPSEDTSRLAFADWLDDNGDPALAELIRVQVELVRTPIPMIETHLVEFSSTLICAGLVNRTIELPDGFVRFRHQQRDDSWYESEEVKIGKVEEFDSARVKVHFVKAENPLRARSDALLAEHEARWRRGAKCVECEDGKLWFANEATSLRAVTCPTCHGTGWSGSLAVWREAEVDRTGTRCIAGWLIPATWSRGFVSSVTCTMGWWEKNGKQAVLEWPLERVEISDRRPYEDVGVGALVEKRSHDWHLEGTSHAQTTNGLPSAIFALVKKIETPYEGPATAQFPSPGEAVAALSAGCLKWARKQG